MSVHESPRPIHARFFSRGTMIIAALAATGMALYLFRIFAGLGRVTNLDNQYPWGIWIAVDVASGVALAAGGFTTAAIVYIFHRREYHAVVRPALLTATLGYTFVVIGLLADLGRYYNVWHPILPSMWQPRSALFEVGMCVMIYLSVLYVEFFPIVIERFAGRVRLPGLLILLNRPIEALLRLASKTLDRFLFLFILAGVVLSCLHQSSLGTLMVIAPTKMSPIWWTPILPLLFLLSAMAVGIPMVIVESLAASRSFHLTPERKTLSALARYVPALLGVYLAVRVIDLTLRGVWPSVWDGSTRGAMFLIELGGGVILPLILLSIRRVRRSLIGLFASALLVVLGVVLNRINVFIVAYQPLYPVKTYFPSVIEILVTLGLACALILAYRWFVMTFPVIATHDRHDSALPTQRAVDRSAAVASVR